MMLLRRMMDHVRDQNWFAVVLDFCIVVLGVFLAFQLQTWSLEREARQRADRSLHQLYEEAEHALAMWTETVIANDERLGQQDRVIAALAAGDRGELDEDTIETAIVGIGRYPTIAPPRRTYDELRSAGLLREIDAPAAMSAVDDYYGEVEFIQGQISFFRPSGDRGSRGIDALTRSTYDPTTPSRQNIVVDFNALAANPDNMETLVSELRNHLVFQYYRRTVMRRAAAMCVTLADAVGATCEGYAAFEAANTLPEWQIRDVPPEYFED